MAEERWQLQTFSLISKFQEQFPSTTEKGQVKHMIITLIIWLSLLSEAKSVQKNKYFWPGFYNKAFTDQNWALALSNPEIQKSKKAYKAFIWFTDLVQARFILN